MLIFFLVLICPEGPGERFLFKKCDSILPSGVFLTNPPKFTARLGSDSGPVGRPGRA